MANLLRAGFFRMKKSPVFWLGVAVMFGWAVLVCWRTHAIQGMYIYHIDDVLFYCNLVVIFLPSVFCALELGTEYDNGTIRNKLVTGCTRSAVYLSSLILTVCAVLTMLLAYHLVVAVMGPLLLEGLRISVGMALLSIAANALAVTALCSLCTMGSLLIPKKAVLAVVLIMGLILLLGVSTTIDNRLQEPEYYPFVTELVDGEFVQREDVPNPGYVAPGVAREIWQFLADFLPTGQALQYHFGHAIHPWRMCLYSLLIILASTSGGLLAFRRKDIR